MKPPKVSGCVEWDQVHANFRKDKQYVWCMHRLLMWWLEKPVSVIGYLWEKQTEEPWNQEGINKTSEGWVLDWHSSYWKDLEDIMKYVAASQCCAATSFSCTLCGWLSAVQKPARKDTSLGVQHCITWAAAHDNFCLCLLKVLFSVFSQLVPIYPLHSSSSSALASQNPSSSSLTQNLFLIPLYPCVQFHLANWFTVLLFLCSQCWGTFSNSQPILISSLSLNLARTLDFIDSFAFPSFFSSTSCIFIRDFIPPWCPGESGKGALKLRWNSSTVWEQQLQA